MENVAPPDPPKPSTPSQATRDPLIRYSVFAALGCAGVCMVFTIFYIFSYSLNSTLSFERHFDSYLTTGNTSNLSTVLGLHMAQNRMFLQSCGMVAGIFFAFVGLALFLVGIQGTVDATGQIRDYATNARRLAPGGVILLASMIFVGVSAMHPIDLVLGPIAQSTTPIATVTQPSSTPSATPATNASTQPVAPWVAPQSSPQQTPQPNESSVTQQQSQPAAAPIVAQPAPQPQQQAAQSQPQLPTPQPAQQQTPAQPVSHPFFNLTPRPNLVPVNQSATSNQPPLHRFQP